MNIRDNFPGHGMTASEADAMEEAADLVDAALAEPIPTPTVVEAKRSLYRRALDKERAEKATQQAIAAAAAAKARQLTVSIRSLEDALDSLLTAEA